MESRKPMKTVIESFREKLAEQIENEVDEKRKLLLIKALQRGTELLEGK